MEVQNGLLQQQGKVEDIKQEKQNQPKTIFEKREGTTDRGKDYEHLFMAHIILQLLTNDKIENFYLSSNHKDFGAFDDVVIEIKYQHLEWETYALQLKHKENANMIYETNLKSQNTKEIFAIKKYFQEYVTCQRLKQDSVKMILFTNSKTKLKPGREIQFNFDKDPLNAVISTPSSSEFLITSGDSHKFLLKDNETREETYHTFFNNFFLCTKQPNVKTFERETYKKFKNLFKSQKSAFNDYVNFIYKWSMDEKRKDKLHKSWLMEVIAVYVLSPNIKSLSFSRGSSITEKTKTLREAVSKFQVTIFNKRSYEQVRTLWKDMANLVSLRDINAAITKYKVGEHFNSNEDLLKADKEITIILWFLRKSPLVIDKFPASETKKGNHLIVLNSTILENFEFFFNHLLMSERKSEEFLYTHMKQHYTCLQNLSDLKQHSQIHEKILHTFTFSLEGQKECSLEKLIEISENIDDDFTCDKLVQMIEGSSLIGQQREILPDCHVDRMVQKVIIDKKILEQLPQDALIVVDSVKESNTLENKNNNIKIVNINDIKEHECPAVYFAENECSFEEFSRLCVQYSEASRAHLLRYLNDNYLEWVHSKSDVKDLLPFRLESYDHKWMEEDTTLRKTNNVNIICANSGMGKTTLMKNLKINSCSSIWTIFIYARNHAEYFRDKINDAGNVDSFLNYILDYNCNMYQDFEKKVFRNLKQKLRVQLIWDGLDEVSSETFESVLKIVKEISGKGIKQFITSRNHLKDNLEEAFNVFSRNLNPFTEYEQKKYIGQRLDLSPEILDDVFDKIKRNIELFSYNDILGIPLQIFMLTELLVRDKKNYLGKIEDAFTIADLYESFVKEKFYIYTKEKVRFDLNNETQFQLYKNDEMTRSECYRKIAVKTYFGKEISIKFNTHQKSMLKKIRSDGDPVGIITRIDKNKCAEFNHNSYGEYFAAFFLSENYDKCVRNRKYIFNKKYQNIRFFLDLILSKKSKGHIAILYKSCLLLEKCSEDELNLKDQAGRDILEMACSWNTGNPTFADDNVANLPYFNGLPYFNRSYEELQYSKLKKYLFDINNAQADLKKIMLLLPFSILLYNPKSRCFNEKYVHSLLYYAISYDYPTVIDYVKKTTFPALPNPLEKQETMLKMAVNANAVHCFRKLLEDPQYVELLQFNCKLLLQICKNQASQLLDICCESGININFTRNRNETFWKYAWRNGDLTDIEFLLTKGLKLDISDDDGKMPLHCVCEDGTPQCVKILVNKGVDLDIADGNGRKPIHYACTNEENGLEIAQILISKNIDLDVSDKRGKMPIHYACEKGILQIVRLLMDNGAKLDHVDDNGRTLVHYICNNKTANLEMKNILIRENVKLNVVDDYGNMPIHYACLNGIAATVQLLVDNGVALDIPNNEGSMPIHYACLNRFEGFKIAKILIGKNINLDVPDKNGRMPIHDACQGRSPELVELLLQHDVKLDVADIHGRTPIHYTCMNETHGLEMTQLLIHESLDLNVSDSRGRMPIHYACKVGSPTLVNILVENGVRLDAADNYGRLPIHYACTRLSNFGESLFLVQVLIDENVNLNVSDSVGQLPIHYACKNGDLELIKLLINNGSKLDAADVYGRMPIHNACEPIFGDSLFIVQVLIDENVNLNVSDSKGQLPIHYACKSENLELVKLLIDNGSKLDAADVYGRMPIHYACMQKDDGFQIAQLLINKNVDLNVLDVYDKTPTDYANEGASLELVKLLEEKISIDSQAAVAGVSAQP